MNLLLLTPAPEGSLSGNRATADRWAGLLRDAGHQVVVGTDYVPQDANKADLLIALRPHEAVSDLRRAYALAETPERQRALGEAVLQSGLVHSSQGTSVDAWRLGKPLLEEAIRLLPGDPRAPLALGEQARAHREFDTALRGFRETIRLDPRQTSPYTSFFTLCSRAGRWDVAREALEGWTKAHPEVVQAHVTLDVGSASGWANDAG